MTKTDQQRFKGVSMVFDGTTSSIPETYPARFDFGEDYTVDFWLSRDLIEAIRFLFKLRAKT